MKGITFVGNALARGIAFFMAGLLFFDNIRRSEKQFVVVYSLSRDRVPGGTLCKACGKR